MFSTLSLHFLFDIFILLLFVFFFRSDCFDYVYVRSRYSNATGHGQRSNLAPQNMQWAIRSREATRSTGVRLAGGSNLVFIDPQTLRRSATANATVAASSEPVTMATTASCLARAFGIVIREIAELLELMQDMLQSPSFNLLGVTQDDVCNVQVRWIFVLSIRFY